MIGMVIFGHGEFSSTMRRALEHVVGYQEHLISVDLVGGNVDKIQIELENAVETVDQGGGVIILTDMFGGTPSNIAVSLLAPGIIDVIAGCNLPMLIKLAECRRTNTFEESLIKAKEAGQRYIAIASSILNTSEVGAPNPPSVTKYQNLYLGIQAPSFLCKRKFRI